MGLFNSLKEIFQKAKQPDQKWVIGHRITVLGLQFQWQSSDQALPLSDPSPEVSASEQDRLKRTNLRLLEQHGFLSGEGILSFEQISKFDAEELQLVQLSYAAGWKLGVRPMAAPGRLNPKLIAEWYTPDGTYFTEIETPRFKAIPCGYLDTQHDTLHILPPGFLTVREKIREQPKFNKVSEEYRFLADIQEAVENANDFLGNYVNESPVTLDGQLAREKYIVPQSDDVKLEARNTADGGIEIRPTLPGFETFESAEALVNPANEIHKLWRNTDQGLGRERIAFDEAVTQKIKIARVLNQISAEEKSSLESDPFGFAQERLQHHPEFQDLSLEILDDLQLGETVQCLIEDNWERTPTIPLPAIVPPAIVPPSPNPNTPIENDLQVDRALETELPEETAPVKLPESVGRVDGFGVPQHISYGVRESGEVPNLLDEVEPIEVPPAPVAPKLVRDAAPVLLTKDNDEEVRFSAEASARLREELSRFPVSNSFRGTLYSHQEEGHIWLRNLWTAALEQPKGQGGLLADEMGLGKTIQVAALLAYLSENRQIRQTLIVVPGAVLQNWEKEIQRFVSPSLRIYLHHGPSRPRKASAWGDHDVIVVPFDTLSCDHCEFSKIQFTTLIVDEAHLIKNYSTLRARAVRAMNARLRIALTATPVENRLEELWSIVDFAQPGLLGSLRDYKKRYVAPIETNVEAQSAARDLLTVLSPHYLRRTKEVLRDLPKKHVHVVPLRMTAEQEDIYDTVRAGLLGRGARGLGIIHTLARTSAHPAATPVGAHPTISAKVQTILGDPERIISSSPKFQFIIDTLLEIKAKGERAIIFTSAKIVQPLLIRAIEHRFGFAPHCVTGDEKMANRPKILNDFNTGSGFDVITLSPQTVGLGVNITGANHVFHLTREWNPSKEDQATDRVYRIGQEREVHVYVPIVKHSKVLSVDERLNQLMEDKGRLTRSVIRASGDLKINDEDFLVCLWDKPTEETVEDIVVLEVAERAASFELKQNRAKPTTQLTSSTAERSLRTEVIELMKVSELEKRASTNQIEWDEFREIVMTLTNGPRHADQIARDLEYPPTLVTGLMASIKQVLNIDGLPVLQEQTQPPRGHRLEGEEVDARSRRSWYSLSFDGVVQLKSLLKKQEPFEDAVARVFGRIQKQTFITGDEITLILGSPRLYRRFSNEIEVLMKRHNMNVVFEDHGGPKIYKLA